MKFRTVAMSAVMAVLLAAINQPALAAAAGGPGTGAAARASSFAGAFFVSKKVDGESIDLIGSLMIWALLGLSLGSIGLIGHLALANQRKSMAPEGVIDEAGELLRQGKFKEAIALTGSDTSFFSAILHAGLSEAGNGYGAMIRGLELAADEHTTLRLRRIEYLNVLGQISPMIGLFGTVYGMIMAFGAIVAMGGTPDPVALAGGIGTALVTTFWGLVVAIPALTGYAVIRNRIDAMATEATHAAEHIINQFRPRAAGGASPAPAAAPKPRPAGPSDVKPA